LNPIQEILNDAVGETGTSKEVHLAIKHNCQHWAMIIRYIKCKIPRDCGLNKYGFIQISKS